MTRMRSACGGYTVRVVTVADGDTDRQEFHLTDRHGYQVGGRPGFKHAGRYRDVAALTAGLARVGVALEDLEEVA